MKNIYLDYAAATPVHTDVLAAMRPFFTDHFQNPSAAYTSAINVRQDLELARARVAQVLGAHERTVVFTAGATESINMALHGVMRRHDGANMLISAVEHEAVLETAQQYQTKQIPVDQQGMVQVESVKQAIDENTVLVSVMYANNEVGTVQPIADIARLLAEVRAARKVSGNKLPLYFHSDASQAAAYLHLNVARLGIDLLTLNGGKMYGPKQSGILYISPDVQLAPWLFGGGQERGLRAGTENVASAVGLSIALQRVQSIRKDEGFRIAELRDGIESRLARSFPNLQINGHKKRRLPNNLNITIPGIDGEHAVMSLDELGVSLATGSACSASNDEPSHVLYAMGLTEVQASSSLRISLGEPTTKIDTNTAIEKIIKALS